MTRKEKLKLAAETISRVNAETASLVQKIGPCKLKPIGTPYQVLLKSVIGQQLSTKAASSIEKKFLSLFENQYPSESELLAINNSKLTGCGISNRKVQTLKLIAAHFQDSTLSNRKLARLSDSQLVNTLCKLKGIGPWTCEMVLMFALDRWDHFSTGDLILRTRIEMHFGIDRNDHKQITKFTEQYSPYRTVLSWYLWADHDGDDRGGWS